MAAIFENFHQAQADGNGNLLASCLVPVSLDSNTQRQQKAFALSSNEQTLPADLRHHIIQSRNAFKLSKQEANAWIDIFTALWKCTRELLQLRDGTGGSWNSAFVSYKSVCTLLVRGYTNFGFRAWTVPCLYVTGKYLRMIAAKADAAANLAAANGATFAVSSADDIADATEKNEKQEDAARTLQQMFNVCRTDDSDLAESRKWAIYSMSNLLFKTFFKLNNLALTKTIIRALDASQLGLPPFTAFPKSQRCTFTYYRGVIEFLQENYSEAEKYLSEALSVCHRDAKQNREQILTYLIPAHMIVQKQLPSAALLSQHAQLQKLFAPLCRAIKLGSLAAFDRALGEGEDELVRRRIYLTLERTRDLCMRNLFRKVFQAAGHEDSKDAQTGETVSIRRTRIRIDEFEAAMRVACTPLPLILAAADGDRDRDRAGEGKEKGKERGKDETAPITMMADRDEVECFIANMIYKGHMKGYIAREQGKVVLSKGNNAFPGTGI